MKKLITILILLFTGISFGQSWTQKSNFNGYPRHRATAFSIGNKGYLGLGHINSVVDVLFDDYWEYDPALNSWTQKANYPYLVFHATGFVIGNKAYVGTGRKQDNSYTTDFFEYDPLTNQWTAVAPFIGAARRGAISFVVNDKGYVGTGQISGWSSSNQFYEYNPVTDSWSEVATFPGVSRTSSVAFSINNVGYVGTGNAGGGTNDFWAYYPNTNTWVQKANVGPTLRQEATGFSTKGKGYIGTGDDVSSGTNYADMWEYTPETDTWVQIQDFAGVPRRYLVSMVIEEIPYVGTGTSGTNFNDFWRFDYALSIQDKLSESILVKTYPNPTVEDITISLANLPNNISTSDLTLKVYSITGQLILNQKFSSQNIELNQADFENGMYVFSISYQDQSIYNSSFIFK